MKVHSHLGYTHLRMSFFSSLQQRGKTAFHQFRYSLSYVDALPQLTLLGLMVGLVTGVTIVVFRLLIESPLALILPNGADDFESLPPMERGMFIAAGLAITYGILLLAGKNARQISVSHVLDRLHNHQGHMPWRNWWVQFLGGAICIISGQSVGREGPAIHLGAGAASRLSRMMRLPHNSRYTLLACGVAAAIAASFDTPMAGVIFAMEVIVMEYTIIGFVPVILASVTGTVVSQLVFDSATPLVTSDNTLKSLLELPFMVFAGLTLACLASAFIRINILACSWGHRPLWLRFSLAGALTFTVAWFVPEVMGLGYDTLNQAAAGSLALKTLVIVAAAKLLTSAIVVGLGVPGGIIGPTLVMGACVGGVLGYTAEWLYSTPTADPGFYVILGMTGMMAAVLNAPLAALVAVLELSYNPHMIFPSMLVIVIACVGTRTLFKLDGIFLEQLKASGKFVQFTPAQQSLKRTGIGNAMKTQLVYANRFLDYERAKTLLLSKPEWVVLDFKEESTRDKVALKAADLATYLSEAPVEILSLEDNIDLLGIPARRLTLSPIHETATLWEALEVIRRSNFEGLYIARLSNPLTASILGIVTEEDIKNYYQI